MNNRRTNSEKSDSFTGEEIDTPDIPPITEELFRESRWWKRTISMIEIKPIQQHQFEQAKQFVIDVILEFWQGDLTEDDLRRLDSMSDIEDARTHYFENHGLFLVLLDDEKIVGTGAIRRLDSDICELKRMWFDKQYRGKGLGWKMAQLLFDFARQAGYQKVRLDLARAEQQAQALKLYTQLGFYSTERYNDGPCEVFMEKRL